MTFGADGASSELESLMAESETARAAHIRILQIEAGLRGSRRDLDLGPSTMARLHGQVAESIAQGVMSEIRAQPITEWTPGRLAEPEDVLSSGREEAPFRSLKRGVQSLLTSAATVPGQKPARFALAACLVLVTGVGFWLFGPTISEPVLAEIQGGELSLERAGQPLPALVGTRLQPGDHLRTPQGVTALLTFTPEKTRLTMQQGADLRLMALSPGKRFTLNLGKVDVSAAPQSSFRPMQLKTLYAEARVLGTRFTLAVTTTSTRREVAEGKVGRAVFPDVRNLPGSWVVRSAKTDTNVAKIEAGVIFPYVGSAGVYHCPAAKATVAGAWGLLRTRSYSLDSWMIAPENFYDANGSYVTPDQIPIGPFKVSQHHDPPPSGVFVFIDEHEQSIDAGWFMIEQPLRVSGGNVDSWHSLASDRHQQGCNLSFLDDHVDHWRWRAPFATCTRTAPVPRRPTPTGPMPRGSSKTRWMRPWRETKSSLLTEPTPRAGG